MREPPAVAFRIGRAIRYVQRPLMVYGLMDFAISHAVVTPRLAFGLGFIACVVGLKGRIVWWIVP